HKSQPGDETFPCVRLSAISQLLAAADAKNQKKKHKRTHRIQQIHERKPDVRDQEPAQSRTNDRSDLKNAVIPSDCVRECVARNQGRKERAARRPTEGARRRSAEKKQATSRDR